MATSGAAAWQKHFRGKGDIQTRLKKESEVYDISSKTKLSYKLPVGTEVTYLKSSAYDSKAAISVKKGRSYISVRVPFDNIAKPGVKSSGASSLKPQAFGVSDSVKYSIDDYTKLISNNIEERKDLSPELKVYLKALVDHSAEKITDSKLSKIYNEVSSDLPLNDIKKDFGEVIGPIAIFKKKLFANKKITLSTRAKVQVPLRPNEPLMDYAIIDGDQTYIISAKSGETTNVVKPKDIIDLIGKKDKTLKKWKNSKEYNVLNLLAENNTLIGPIKAVGFMEPNLIDYENVGDTARNFNQESVGNFINQNEYLSKKTKPTINEIMYECEKYIQKKSSSGDLDINSIFADAILSSVIYVKFDISSNGTGSWDVIVSDDIKKQKNGKKAYLRTKNGYTRAADKMGVQV